MGIKLGICGTGSFADAFIPFFKVHPLVDEVTLCDLDQEKLRQKSERFEIPRISPSLDALCETDVDAIAIITQNWLHAPQAIQALRAGKHVYSAVPSAITVQEMTDLVHTVEATGKIYMLGETSYYYPSVLYCRERYRTGDFGSIVYAEAEYYHDWDHGLYDVAKWRGGDRWREFGGIPPMYYPTHSTSTLMSITKAYATHVSCLGFVDHHEDGVYAPGANALDNRFSNEVALLKMSDGSSFRINEFRRIGHPGAVRMSMFGTEGSFEDSLAGQNWCTKNGSELVTELLTPKVVSAQTSGEGMDLVTASDGTHMDVAAVHPVHRLPKEFIGMSSGHMGSHQFLVDDFVKSCAYEELPPNHVWAAARYLMPGLIAHESAIRGGELLAVPDLGEAKG